MKIVIFFKQLVFTKAEAGHLGYLVLAARICLHVGPFDDYQGHLYLLKADAFAKNKLGVTELDNSLRQTLYSIMTRTDGLETWSDRKQMLADLEAWKSRILT